MHFGEHVTIDGYGGDAVRLNDPALIGASLVALCAALGMRALSEPRLVSAPDNLLKDPGGWSGFLIVAESHIAIHTFPRRRFLSADVYTCQNGIDQEFIVAFFTDKFCLSDTETNFVVRGKNYPAHNVA